MLLKDHLDAVEERLLAQAKVPANSGHPLHKGTPRETFIREFLSSHLSERLAVGQGEVIDANSQAGERRNQLDIVLYKREYPKIDFGGGISAFLAESVVVTIEVKSTLDEEELKKAIQAAVKLKKLERHVYQALYFGRLPPSILCYVVAYGGPASMRTVHSWITRSHDELGIAQPEMGSTLDDRMKVPAPSVDGVFVLGKGFLLFDNTSLNVIPDDERARSPHFRYWWVDISAGSLLMLFLMITSAISGTVFSTLNPVPYVKDWTLGDIQRGD